VSRTSGGVSMKWLIPCVRMMSTGPFRRMPGGTSTFGSVPVMGVRLVELVGTFTATVPVTGPLRVVVLTVTGAEAVVVVSAGANRVLPAACRSLVTMRPVNDSAPSLW
jgi:hypothetical protein